MKHLSIQTHLAGAMGEKNKSVNDILLQRTDKDIPINLSLLTTPIKDTPSINKRSTTSTLDIDIDENYNKAAKMQLKQVIQWEVKQQLPNKRKKNDTLMKFFAVFVVKFLHLKVKFVF